jgi:hypothetical protein
MRGDTSDSRDDVPLAAALRSLPLPTPPSCGWPRMQARLRRRRRQRVVGWALAASLLTAVALAPLLPTGDPEAPAVAVALPGPAAPIADPAARLQGLLDESARLEALLAWSGHAWVDSGDSAALDAHLATRLQWLDLRLADAPSSLDQQLPLWSERVLLLRQRARLAQERVLLADRDGAAASDPLLVL